MSGKCNEGIVGISEKSKVYKSVWHILWHGMYFFEGEKVEQVIWSSFTSCVLYSNESRGNKKSIIECKKKKNHIISDLTKKARGYVFIIVDVGKSKRKVKL